MKLEERISIPQEKKKKKQRTAMVPLIFGGKEQSVQSAWSWVSSGAPQGQQKDVIINYHIITLMYDNY